VKRCLGVFFIPGHVIWGEFPSVVCDSPGKFFLIFSAVSAFLLLFLPAYGSLLLPRGPDGTQAGPAVCPSHVPAGLASFSILRGCRDDCPPILHYIFEPGEPGFRPLPTGRHPFSHPKRLPTATNYLTPRGVSPPLSRTPTKIAGRASRGPRTNSPLSRHGLPSFAQGLALH